MSSPASTSGATGASNEAAIWTAIRAMLLSAGWTETILVAGVNARSSAFQSIPIDTVAGNKVTIVCTEALGTHALNFQTGTDWDPVNNVLINKAGDTTSTITVNTTQNTYKIRANNWSLFVATLANASAPYKVYVGWWRRGLYRNRSGITTATGAGTIGQTSTPVSSDMTGRLVVGQRIHRVNFGHSSSSPNAGNAEAITITSITGGGSPSIGHSALTKNYDTGALLGERPMNTGVMANTFVDWTSCQTSINNSGGRSGSTGSTAFYNTSITGPSSMKPDSGNGYYPPGYVQMTWNSESPTAANGFFGKPFSVIWTYLGTGSYYDVYDDGLRQYCTVGATTGIQPLLATDTTTTPLRYLYPNPGLRAFDQEDEGAEPGVPTTMSAPSATAGNAQAVVTWAAATADWPNAVTGYKVTAYPEGQTLTVGNVLTGTVTGLTNGVKTSFTVHAINAVGDGNESPESIAVTPSATATAPGVPTSVAANIFSTSAVITWSPPVSDGGSAVTNYTVSGFPGGPFTTGGATFYVASGLTPGTTYSITVAATNSIGTGSTAGVSAVIAAAVPSAPQSLAMSSVTSSSATIGWAAPASNGGAAITGYVVSGHPAGPTTVGAGVTSLAITGLSAGDSYTLSVVATNSVGTGTSASTTFSASTAAPSVPQSFVATAEGSTEGLLQWEDPAALGGTALIHYRITGLPGGTFDIAGTANSYLATGLSPGTAYTVTVAAINSAGMGSAASQSFTTAAVVPTVPRSLAAGTITSTSAVLTWLAPTSNGGSALTGYAVHRVGGSSSSVGAGVLTATLTSLTPGQEYSYEVWATNAVGASPVATVTFTALAEPPSVPLSLVATVLGSTGILTWAPPASEGGGDVTDYSVGGMLGGPFLTGGATCFFALGLTPGTAYTLTVAAVNSEGAGPMASVVTTVSAPPVDPPGSTASFLQPNEGREVDFGVDVSTFPALDTTFSTIRGFRVLAEALARRLMTPKGLLTFHQDYGFDLRQFINESINDITLTRIKQGAVHEMLQDERVSDADATVVYTQATQSLSLTAKVVTSKGAFSFVLTLDNVRVDLYLGAA